MNEARPTLQAGALLAGRWRIESFIGRGQLAEVYGVRDTHGGAEHALKIWTAGGLTRPEVWSAFQSAVKAVAAAGSEGVARASDFGIDGNSGRPFYVTELVSWPSLGRHVAANGPLSPEALSAGLNVIARALDSAHAAGVVHRNLKPENVFISPDNPSWARVTDFGVSILRAAAPPPPGWAAEIGWHSADGADPAQRPSPAMDIYQLGLVCFFALTTGSPFRAMRSTPVDPNQLWRELGEPLGPLSVRARELGVTLSPAFDAWFSRALAQAPSDRFGKATEMAEAFAALVAKSGRASAHSIPDALPGIAAAIPQPLVFQPEPPKQATAAVQAALSQAQASPAQTAPAAAAAEEPDVVAGVPSRKKGLPTTQLFIGGAVLCFAATAAGAFALYRSRAAESEAEAQPAASAVAPVASTAAPTPVAPSAAPAPEPSAAPPVAKARFICEPGPCEWVVCDGKNIRGFDKDVEVAPGEHTCSASRYGHGSKATIFTAKVGETTDVKFELPALPATAAKKAAAAPAPSVAAAKDAAKKPDEKTTAKTTTTAKAAASAPAKSAASATAKTTSKTTAKKGKCGTFINPCK